MDLYLLICLDLYAISQLQYFKMDRDDNGVGRNHISVAMDTEDSGVELKYLGSAITGNSIIPMGNDRLPSRKVNYEANNNTFNMSHGSIEGGHDFTSVESGLGSLQERQFSSPKMSSLSGRSEKSLPLKKRKLYNDSSERAYKSLPIDLSVPKSQTRERQMDTLTANLSVMSTVSNDRPLYIPQPLHSAHPVHILLTEVPPQDAHVHNLTENLAMLNTEQHVQLRQPATTLPYSEHVNRRYNQNMSPCTEHRWSTSHPQAQSDFRPVLHSQTKVNAIYPGYYTPQPVIPYPSVTNNIKQMEAMHKPNALLPISNENIPSVVTNLQNVHPMNPQPNDERLTDQSRTKDVDLSGRCSAFRPIQPKPDVAQLEHKHNLQAQKQQSDAARERCDSPSHIVHDTPTDEECRVVSEADEDGDIPLHIAVVQEEKTIIDKLLMIMNYKNMKLDYTNNMKQTPLHLAIITKHAGITKTLLKAGASPNIADRRGLTCCHLAVKYKTPECLAVVFEHSTIRVEVDIKNYDGLTALHRAVQLNQLDCAQLLISNGAQIDIGDGKSGKTPLYLAFECNQPDAADMLLTRGADVNIPTYSGSTVLQAANSRGQHLLNHLFTISNIESNNSSVRELQNKLAAKNRHRSKNQLNTYSVTSSNTQPLAKGTHYPNEPLASRQILNDENKMT